jgi:hypothetical protein
VPKNPLYVNTSQSKRIAKAMTHRYGLKQRRAGIVIMAAATRVPSVHGKLAVAAAGAATYAYGKRMQIKARRVAQGHVKSGQMAPTVTYTSTRRGATKFSGRRVKTVAKVQYTVQVNNRAARKQQYSQFPLKRSTTHVRENGVRRDLQKKSTYAKMTRSQAARKAALARWGTRR